MRQKNDPALQSAKTLLTTPDLFNFWPQVARLVN
jgi:hypothetical protein